MKMRNLFRSGSAAIMLLGSTSLTLWADDIVWTESTDTPPWTLEEGSQLEYTRYDGSDGSRMVIVTGGDHFIPVDKGGGDICGGKVGETVKETTIIVNGGTRIKRIIGGNENYGYIEGDRNIIINDGEADNIYGGDWYIKPNHGGLTNGYYSEETYGVQSSTNEWVPLKSKGDINITINGGKIGQLRGGHNCEDGVNINTTSPDIGYYVDENGNTTETRPYSVGGDVNIVISGGEVGKAGQSDAIRGAGGSMCSVDGTVNITVKDEARIIGDIYTGARNKYAQVGGTNVSIEGGKVEGDVFAGGSYDSCSALNLGDAAVTLSGGEVTGNVYAAGDKDVIKGDTRVTVLNNGTKLGENSIVSGGGVNGALVEGTRYLNIGSRELAATCALNITDFDVLTVADGSSATLSAVEGSPLTLDNLTLLTTTSAAQHAISLNLDGVTFSDFTIAICLDSPSADLSNFSLTLTGEGLENIANPNVVFLDSVGNELQGENLQLTYLQHSSTENQYIISASVPEPATATLSLLALAGLAARRRRRG